MSRRESYRTSNAYTSNSYSSSKSKTTTTNITGGGGDSQDNKLNYLTSTKAKTNTKKAAEIKAKNKIKQDMVDFANYTYQPPEFMPSLVGNVFASLVGEKTFEVNKAYYEKNVIGKMNPATGKPYSANIDEFKGYMKGRTGGTLDAMGRTIYRNDNDSGQVVIEKKIGGNTILTQTPTSAEVSQAKATEQAAEDIETRKRRVKAKGRSPTILTGVTGATGGLTLGKPSLLGRA
jgi:hypothetical protein